MALADSKASQSSSASFCIAWHMEKTGIFSVQSAYNLALNIKEESSYKFSSGQREEVMDTYLEWRSIAKVKVFIGQWRPRSSGIQDTDAIIIWVQEID